MCLLAIQFDPAEDSPILVMATREEFYDRPSTPPAIHSGRPRVLCPTDDRAGGTWIGVNQKGVFVAVTNRKRRNPPAAPISRGLLCRQLLECWSAEDALSLAEKELRTGNYDGANFVIADLDQAGVIYGDEMVDRIPLEAGLHFITDGNLNNPRDERQGLARRLLTLQQLDTAVAFLAVASNVCARRSIGPNRPEIVMRGKDRGTVSATLIAVGKKPRDAVFQYAPGPPDETSFEDYSPLMRDILSRGLREESVKD
ncbi:MAG: NRDE family protein [Pirellulales bacterium]|nr:NRDE family protein [Pirellulales bacterium]